MCLISNRKPRIAKKDIVVWKVFVDKSDIDPQFRSLYQGFPYKENEEMPDIKLVPKSRTYGNEYRQGYHSFRHKEYAEALAKHHGSLIHTVGKCIIPKGAEYVLGDFNLPNANDSYVSSTIILCATS